MKRRTFLQRSSFVSLAPFVPAFVPQSVNAADPAPDSRILVVLQLDGGNDGLNTLVPYADENYARYREQLRIEEDRLCKLNDSVGLHPEMRPMADLFEGGKLAVVQGVGYPNPNRSHFESMDIWHSGRLNVADRDGYGWLGRATESTRPPLAGTNRIGRDAHSVYVGDTEIPVALRGRRAQAISLNHEEELQLAASLNHQPRAPESSDLNAFVQRTVDSSYAAAKRFSNSVPTQKGGRFPRTQLGRKMELLSRLIKLGLQTRVFYVSQPGFDTHYEQTIIHANLLRDFSRCVAAFQKEMDVSGLADRVVLMAFSEFGRRVRENGSAGTDHGTAGPVFVCGARVRSGLHGSYPPLADLDNGDLKMTVDFRTVYATLLQRWLDIDPVPVLKGSFATTNVV